MEEEQFGEGRQEQQQQEQEQQQEQQQHLLDTEEDGGYEGEDLGGQGLGDEAAEAAVGARLMALAKGSEIKTQVLQVSRAAGAGEGVHWWPLGCILRLGPRNSP